MKKDPHLAFARGGRADFRGRNGAYYAFLSTPGLQVNVRTEEATFKSFQDALTVDGSFITEVHVLGLVGGEKHKLATASFWTSELNEFTTGPNMINGTCGDRGQFFLGTGGYKKCEELEVAIKFSSARFRVPGWTIKVAAARVWGHISGPVHRLDVSLHAHGVEAALHRTHGLVGQSFGWRTARDGKRDLYPTEGRFRTSAMAEGAIEGNAVMYELSGPLATEFPFSRFREAKPMMLSPPAGAAMVDASSTDQVEVAGGTRRMYEPVAIEFDSANPAATSEWFLGEAPSATGAASTGQLDASIGPTHSRRLSETPCPPPSAPPPARDRDAFYGGCLGSRYGCCTECETVVDCEGVPAKSSDKDDCFPRQPPSPPPPAGGSAATWGRGSMMQYAGGARGGRVQPYKVCRQIEYARSCIDIGSEGYDVDISTGVVAAMCSIYGAWGKCVAVKSDGSAVAWGDARAGGDALGITSCGECIDPNACYDRCSPHAAALSLPPTCSGLGSGLDDSGSCPLITTANLSSGVVTAMCGGFACVAVKNDSSAEVWGAINATMGYFADSVYLQGIFHDGPGDAPGVDLRSDVLTAMCGLSACVAVKSDGSAVVWGDPRYGGIAAAVFTDNPGNILAYPEPVPVDLTSGVVSAMCGGWACVAVKSNGSAVAWGNAMNGGDASGFPYSYVIADLSSDVVSAHCGYKACVAVKSDGSAVTWGDPLSGGDAAGALMGCVGGDFNHDGEVDEIAGCIRIGYPDVEYPVRGNPPRRGDPGGTQNSCPGYPYYSSFFGHGGGGQGGGCTTADLRSGVASAMCGSRACVAVMNSGKAVSWGEPLYGGGAGAGIDADIVASRVDGAVIPSEVSNVVSAMCGGNACVAVTKDGKAVAWGHPKMGGDPTGVSSQKDSCQSCKGGMSETTYVSPDDLLSSGVIAAMCGGQACVAVKSDGSAHAWGLVGSGGRPSCVWEMICDGDTYQPGVGVSQGCCQHGLGADLASGVVSAMCGGSACVAVKTPPETLD